jgi:hypothetical protein
VTRHGHEIAVIIDVSEFHKMRADTTNFKDYVRSGPGFDDMDLTRSAGSQTRLRPPSGLADDRRHERSADHRLFRRRENYDRRRARPPGPGIHRCRRRPFASAVR